jgi:hypothetical protein
MVPILPVTGPVRARPFQARPFSHLFDMEAEWRAKCDVLETAGILIDWLDRRE